ncbi:MAG: translation elongation factor G, partial [Lachnospiraceae bacterium]|nr:translation elongation factor G [Lachnospiraceae bacterium]
AYMEQGSLADEEIAKAVAQRKVFPVYFGSALKLLGVEELLSGMERYCAEKKYPEAFGAKVYKIERDGQGKRLTWMKLTGGSLGVRQSVEYGDSVTEKIDQIRLYNGAKFKTAECVSAGEVCAVTGLSATCAGQGLGAQEKEAAPVMMPVMTYRAILPEGCDVIVMLKHLRELAEEEPLLHIRYVALLQEIHVQLMGQVQIEVLAEKIRERFGVAVGFDAGSILYRETIAEPVLGMGHYEPLRHYAEVHLLMEPGEPGSGLVFRTACPEDMLEKNWQRLVLTHLAEREHLGVLSGSPITDMRITLVAGRAHIKHTEGGDFRQATYRAVRHGLMCAKSVLLEPYYEFRMELP